MLYGQLARQGLVAWGKVMLYEVWSGYKMQLVMALEI